MATKIVQFCLSERLTCSDVILCLKDAALVAQPDPPCGEEITTIEAEICQFYNLCSPAALNQLWTYKFSYDTDQLADPTTPLVTADIEGVFCRSCLTDWVEQQISCVQTAAEVCVEDSTTIDFSLTEEGCVTGSAILSEYEGNILQSLEDGLYAEIAVSEDAGNIIELRGDGLFAEASASDSPFVPLYSAAPCNVADLTTDEVEIGSYTVPANTLQECGDRLEAKAYGQVGSLNATRVATFSMWFDSDYIGSISLTGPALGGTGLCTLFCEFILGADPVAGLGCVKARFRGDQQIVFPEGTASFKLYEFALVDLDLTVPHDIRITMQGSNIATGVECGLDMFTVNLVRFIELCEPSTGCCTE